MANANDIDTLQKAYHYNQLMSVSKPHLDTWTRALDEGRMNPQHKDKWRGVMVLTGEEDPDKAMVLATQEYLKLRDQHGQYNKAYSPLREQLKARGITPEMYGNEALFLQLMNQRKFQPHTLQRGAPTLSPLSRRLGMRRSFRGR